MHREYALYTVLPAPIRKENILEKFHPIIFFAYSGCIVNKQQQRQQRRSAFTDRSGADAAYFSLLILRHRRKPDAAMYSLGDVSRRRIPDVTGCISQSSHRRKSKPGMDVHHHKSALGTWGFPMAMGMTSAMTSSLSFCSLFYRENFNGP